MNIGRVLGWLIVTGYTLTLMNYIAKLINRKWIMKMPKDAPARVKYQVFLRFVVKNHRFFAMFTTAVLITHFIIQYLSWGFYITGLIAGSLLILQGALGGFGHYVKKKKSGPWLYAHRTVAVLMLVAIFVHVLTAKLT